MANQKEGEDELIITRLFEAPRERVWQAWADQELMKKWWGPEGFFRTRGAGRFSGRR